MLPYGLLIFVVKFLKLSAKTNVPPALVAAALCTIVFFALAKLSAVAAKNYWISECLRADK